MPQKEPSKDEIIIDELKQIRKEIRAENDYKYFKLQVLGFKIKI